MNKRIILTVDDHAFLIPEEQSKDLTGLLTQLNNWYRVKAEGYGNKTFTTYGIAPTLAVSVIDALNITEKTE